MANSGLVVYEDYSPMITEGRGGYNIVYIAVHHMAGNLSVETCGNVFHNREASAHYGIDNSGRIGQYVAEGNTAWSLGNFKRNQQSINIELANDGGADSNWHVADLVIERCIDLITDICRRLGWTYLSYTGDLNGDLIMHRMVISTTCPGDYLAGKFPYIADEVTKRLKGQAGKIDEDGIIGYNTIYNWQRVMASPYTDGEISGQLIAAKKYVTSTTDAWVFNDGAGSGTIKKWQSMLQDKGYDIGPDGADGYFGYYSALATQKFLVDEGFSVGSDGCDGYFGPDSSIALQKWINKKLG